MELRYQAYCNGFFYRYEIAMYSFGLSSFKESQSGSSSFSVSEMGRGSFHGCTKPVE